jgi:hypothetical protein
MTRWLKRGLPAMSYICLNIIIYSIPPKKMLDKIKIKIIGKTFGELGERNILRQIYSRCIPPAFSSLPRDRGMKKR